MTVVSSNSDSAQVIRTASTMAPAAILNGATQIKRAEGDFFACNFTVPR